jgi:spoIIIJ-associated protein
MEELVIKIEPEKVDQIRDLIDETLQKMGVSARVSVEENIRGFVFNISSPDSNLLIGQKGANLQSLQSLMQTIAFKKLQVTARFTLDVDDYKKKREWYLRETAKKALEHMRKTGRSVLLEPMPAHERRIIHAYLSTEDDIETESTGQEPARRIIIKLKEKGSI